MCTSMTPHWSSDHMQIQEEKKARCSEARVQIKNLEEQVEQLRKDAINVHADKTKLQELNDYALQQHQRDFEM